MPTTDWLRGRADEIDIHGQRWDRVENAEAYDESFAECNLGILAGGSNYIYMSHFDHGIPYGSTISGIEAIIMRAGSTGRGIQDVVVALSVGGEIIGANKARSRTWSERVEEALYGGPGDNWEVDLTHDLINSGAFGFVLSCQNHELGDETAMVDYMSIRITYTEPAVFWPGNMDFVLPTGRATIK